MTLDGRGSHSRRLWDEWFARNGLWSMDKVCKGQCSDSPSSKGFVRGLFLGVCIGLYGMLVSVDKSGRGESNEHAKDVRVCKKESHILTQEDICTDLTELVLSIDGIINEGARRGGLGRLLLLLERLRGRLDKWRRCGG